MKIKIFFLLFSSIASKSLSIPSASAWKEILEAYDTVLEKVSQEESDCLAVTPKKIRAFFERVENFPARVKDDCADGKGDFVKLKNECVSRFFQRERFSFQNEDEDILFAFLFDCE
ncbi:Oidioi.mRNA.OKI2018_I69.chr1.g854.t1.cds [Oikopleura dioica]|uniref:Oidioi.mRNA.OKI2018_I69.chr1.g839.t1.cds n=1 Tax=Oikopleura dioica TaxID=34765 RepID=A0ABN7SMU7_OIKDI|nr:Oidioi.mRNA.OKI2018_I69.chr1.g839.t1.cds [Oikopleura dioica]CAG5103618.1 Oidioi.mRNA.OKI2018_I69.chr1.g854.t1.cds [Oikopleura dioica]